MIGATKTSAPGGWFTAAAAVGQSSVVFVVSVIARERERTLGHGRRAPSSDLRDPELVNGSRGTPGTSFLWAVFPGRSFSTISFYFSRFILSLFFILRSSIFISSRGLGLDKILAARQLTRLVADSARLDSARFNFFIS